MTASDLGAARCQGFSLSSVDLLFAGGSDNLGDSCENQRRYLSDPRRGFHDDSLERAAGSFC